MSEFFIWRPADDEHYAPFGVARSVDPTVFFMPESGQSAQRWKPIAFALDDGLDADFLSNDIGARLCSTKLKRIIQENSSTENDPVDWLDVIVQRNGARLAYDALHFPSSPEVLDRARSKMSSNGVLVRPVLAAERLRGHDIFALPGEVRTCFVSRRLKEAIERGECTGIEFGKAHVA